MEAQDLHLGRAHPAFQAKDRAQADAFMPLS